MQLYYLLSTLLIAECFAETKWVWERSYNSDPYPNRRDDYKLGSSGYRNPSSYSYEYDRNRYPEFDRIRDLERLQERERERERERNRERDRNRQRDREPITKRPYTRPSSGQEDFDDYDIDDQKYGYDQFRPGIENVRPYALPPRQLPPIESLRPNPQNGILVGPGGPTGIIGRPNQQNIINSNNRLPLNNGIPNPNDLRPNPANGVLVGPGGPTGIIGRPQYGNGGSGGGGYPQYGNGGGGGGGGYPQYGNGVGNGNVGGIGSQVGGFPPIGPNGIGSNSFPPQGFNPNVGQLPSGIGGGIGGLGPGGIIGPGAGIGGAGNIGSGLYPNQGGQQGLYPANGIYGYPTGPSASASLSPYGNSNIYPAQYPGKTGREQGQYGLYTSEYYPIGSYGQNPTSNRPYLYPYNNELGANNYAGNGYYAPGFDEFARSASTIGGKSSKDKTKDDKKKVKKSINDKLATV